MLACDWFIPLVPIGFADDLVYILIEAVVLSWNRNASGELGVDKVFVKQDVICMVPSAVLYSISDAVVYMCPHPQQDKETTDRPLAWTTIVAAYVVELLEKGEWDLKNILSSG